MSDKKENNKSKLPLTASHLVLYIVLFVYIIVAIYGLILIGIIFNDYPDLATQLVIAEFSFTGICGTASIGFYTNKAKSENDTAAQNRKFNTKYELAKEVHNDKKNDNIDAESVMIFKGIVSESETTITTSGYNGITEIDEIKFGNDLKSISDNINTDTYKKEYTDNIDIDEFDNEHDNAYDEIYG